MTTPEKKKYLLRYRVNLKMIARLEKRVTEIEARMYTTSPSNLSGMPRGGRPVTKEDLADDKDELLRRIAVLKAKGKRLRREIVDVIDTVDDALVQEILEYYFVDGMDFADICDALGYTMSWVTQTFQRGIREVDL